MRDVVGTLDLKIAPSGLPFFPGLPSIQKRCGQEEMGRGDLVAQHGQLYTELRANSGVGVINKRAGTRVCRGDARKEFQLALHQEEKGEKRAWMSVLAAMMHSTSDSSE